MSSIEVSNSRAIQLAIELEGNLKSHKDLIKGGEQRIQKIQADRMAYDEENNQYDMQVHYPAQDFLKGRYQEKTELLKTYTKEQRELFNIYKELNQKLIKLESTCLAPAIIENLKFIHETAGREIEAYHSDLKSRVKKLAQGVYKLGEVANKSFAEIDWILKHPHRRLEQMIERVAHGQESPGYIAPLYDRITRNFSNVSSLLFSYQSSSFEVEEEPAKSSNSPINIKREDEEKELDTDV